MIESFIKAWDSHQGTLKDAIKSRGNDILDYKELLKTTLSHCFPEQEDDEPDVSKVHEIDDGSYQGTLLFVVPEQTYQPCTYFVFKVSYGSCSGCDAMEGIRSYGEWDSEGLSDKKVDLLWTEALHMMQQAVEV